ncbi:MAG: hypothetical protein Q9160_006617 [Pyrenula sp. 1 TL-2023]
MKTFHRPRSYSAAPSLDEESKTDDVFTSPSDINLRASIGEEEELLESMKYLIPAERWLASARHRLEHHGLMSLATGEEIRPDLRYSGKWEFDEDLAKQHSQWIGRDAKARDILLSAFQGFDQSDELAGHTDAHQLWTAAEAATQSAVSEVSQSLLNSVHNYVSADQVCRELESLTTRLQDLGTAASPETLMVVFAYNTMHPLDRLIFRKSLPLLHPSTWCLNALRQHEIIWDSVFDELFDLESDWNFNLDEEHVIITIKESESSEEYRIGAETLFDEFKHLAVYDYDQWLAGHPTHFQKCDATCPNRKSISGIHYRTTGDLKPQVKDAADALSARLVDKDMDRYRPPQKRKKDEPKAQSNGISPVTPVESANVT